MFGKRSSTAVGTTPAAQPTTVAPAAFRGLPDPTKRAAPSFSEPVPPRVPETQRSDEYYITKSMIFGALIEGIDLSQLARLDAESAREEIRDIVNEIISIKNI